MIEAYIRPILTILCVIVFGILWYLVYTDTKDDDK